MSGIFDPSGNWARAAVESGIDVAAKAAALILLCWLVHAALGKRRALHRSALWYACILGLIGLPVANLALPRLPIGITPASRGGIASPDSPDAQSRSSRDGVDPRSSGVLIDRYPADAGRRGSSAPVPPSTPPQSRRPTEAATNDQAPSPTRGQAEATPRPWGFASGAWPLVGLYVGVAVLLALRLASSLAAVGRCRSRCEPVEDPAWLEARDRWAAHLGLGRPVELLRSGRASVPFVVGHVRPAIILPRSLTDGADTALVDAVILHELGHVRRGDFGWNLARKLVQILYWPHPLTWLLGRIVGEVREQACDDLCVHALGGAPTYRASLVEVASGLVRRPGPALGLAMARATSLSRRLAWIDRSRGASRCLLRWPTRITFAASVVALAGLLGSVEPSRSTAGAAEGPRGPAQDAGKVAQPAEEPKSRPEAQPRAGEVASLDEVVAAVRAEERKYRDIEYSLRRTTRKVDPKAPGGPGEVEAEETRRVVLQGDLVWFRGETTGRVFGAARRHEEVSAFDGERTRTVVAGNSVNVHIGRFEHPDVYPPHTVPLIHYRVDFPLSVYLSGGDAIHAHPKYGRFARESGSTHEFTRVEARIEGEELVAGLPCLKIRVDRWYYSNSAPARQYLWLAPGRNYLCLKEQLSWPKSMFGDLPMHEMRVDDLREIAPGLWFPMKVTVVDYDGEALRRKELVVGSRIETAVEKVNLDPRNDLAFFRDVEIPAGLPVFTIQDGKILGSSLPEPVGDEATEKAKLEEVVARVREQEQRYADLEVRARVSYKHLGSDLFMEGIIVDQVHEERSVLREPSAYFAKRGGYDTIGGLRSEESEVRAFDGRWTRGLQRMTRDGEQEQRWASLRKGGGGKVEGRHDGVPVLRPHTLLIRDAWLCGSLSDMLVSPWIDKVNDYRLRFRYCGEEDLDGHACVKLRGEVIVREGQPPSSFMALWLATDRNYIPVKVEHYGGNHGLRPMPGGISRCDDLREIAPGIWYPFRSTVQAFDDWINMARRRVTLNWRRVYEIESATPSPAADAALFRDVTLPAKTKVQVSDEDGRFLGEYEQAEEGVAEVSPARYLSLLADAKIRDEEQEERQRAIGALIGKPAPEFPAGATWLNSEPLTWASLRGKVVILDFWAEWCAPCRDDLPQLSLLHDAREANGLVVVGVHPPDNEPAAIKKMMDEFRLGYPICVDVPPREGLRAWGDLFGQFAVHAIPHAVAVDDQGTIVACGRLQEVLAKANELTKRR